MGRGESWSAAIDRLMGSVVLIAFIGALHVALWGNASLAALHTRSTALGLAVAYVVSIVVHEALHVAGFVWLGGAPRSAVRVEFRGVTAAVHCAVALPARAYRIAVALPGLVLGVIPALAGLALGMAWLTAYGAVMTGAAFGDARVLWSLRRLPPTAPVIDRG
jgi:hypothetical protein